MNDLEFRRRAYAEPDCQDNKFLDKKNATQENQKFVDELKDFDLQTKDAMNVEVPEGLSDRIILNQTLGQHEKQKHNVRVLFSIAASILIMLSVVFIFLSTSSINLEQEVLTHIYDELNYLDEQQHNDIHHVNNLLSSFGGTVNKEIGKVNYLSNCNIANKKGVHMVLAGEVGAVTVMIMPDISVESVRALSDDRFDGAIIPAGKGSMVVVGEKGESLDKLKNKLKNNISWVI